MSKNTTKDIIFYIVIVLIFYIFARSALYLNKTLNINIDLLLVLFAVLFTGIIFLLRHEQKDSFTFQLTPEKHCRGGSYMWGDGEKRKFCSQFTPQDIGYFSCSAGFHGAPVHWRRTNISNNEWENRTCDCDFKRYNDPEAV